MPVGALSKGPRPAGTALAPLLPHNHPQQKQLQRQLQALNSLSKFPSARIAPLLAFLALNGPATITEIAKGLGWDACTASHVVRRFSTGCFRNGKPEIPHAVLLWVQPQPGAPGPHLQIALRPEGVDLALAALGLKPIGEAGA